MASGAGIQGPHGRAEAPGTEGAPDVEPRQGGGILSTAVRRTLKAGEIPSTLIECVHAVECAGCPLITSDYAQQLGTKRERVVGAVAHYPALDLLYTQPVIPADPIISYRGRAKLIVAPMSLRARLLELIEAEAQHADGRIVLKANSLSDPELIAALYRASQRGVQIDLIIRSICCLRPGVPGVSENIRVRSIIGRYLEHSRIYRFGSDVRGPRYFIGSADLMARNLDQRVEVVAPVEDEVLVERLREVLDANLADDRLAWELEPEGRWQKVPTVRGFDVQEYLIDAARRRSDSGSGSGSN